MKEFLSQKVLKNSLSNGLGGVISGSITLALTPFIIYHVGVKEFGLWSLTSILTSYVALADLGISSALVKYVASSHERGDKENVESLVNASLLIFAAMGFAAFLFFLSWKRWLLAYLFQDPALSPSKVEFVVVSSMVLFVINFIASAFPSTLNGIQRMDIANGVAVATSVVGALATFAFLSWGYGLEGLVYANAVATFFSAGLGLLAVRWVIPQMTINPCLARLKSLKQVFRFGAFMQVTAFQSLIFFQLDKGLLSYFLEVRYVAYYEVAARLATYVRTISLLMISPIMPAASVLQSGDNREGINRMYYYTTKYNLVLGLLLAAAAIIFAPYVVHIWVGPDFGLSVRSLQLLVAAYFFNVICCPVYFISVGLGNLKETVYYATLASALHLILSVPLIIWIGYYGTLWGTLLATAMAMGYYIYSFHCRMGIPLWGFLKRLFLAPLLSCAGASAVVYVLGEGLSASGPYALGLLASLFALLYIGGLAASGYFDAHDRELVAGLLLLARR